MSKGEFEIYRGPLQKTDDLGIWPILPPLIYYRIDNNTSPRDRDRYRVLPLTRILPIIPRPFPSVVPIPMLANGPVSDTWLENVDSSPKSPLRHAIIGVSLVDVRSMSSNPCYTTLRYVPRVIDKHANTIASVRKMPTLTCLIYPKSRFY